MVKASLRTKSVGTKVSDAEYAALEVRARAENLTLSEWMRARLLEPDTDGADLPSRLGRRTIFWAKFCCRRFLRCGRVLNLRPLPDHALPGEAEVRAEIARVDATKMQRARERLAAQKKASDE